MRLHAGSHSELHWLETGNLRLCLRSPPFSSPDSPCGASSVTAHRRTSRRGALIAVEAALVSPGKLAMTAIDVGQDDSLLMISPDGHTDAAGPQIR
jgi:hypothetical protein